MRRTTLSVLAIAAVSLAILALAALPAMAAPGDTWILGIHHINNEGSFTTYGGAGYGGPQSSGAAGYVGNAYGRSTADGVARIYWELSGLSVNNSTPVPASTELYRVEFYGTTEAGHNNWQPVESQFHGIVGEGGDGMPPNPAIDIHIPWAGQYGTNHQYIAADGADDGLWHLLGLGPQADTNPPGDNRSLWLTAGSWLYSKWDFGWNIDRSWSALRLTQVTGVIPEPASGLLLFLGGVLMVVRRNRRTA